MTGPHPGTASPLMVTWRSQGRFVDGHANAPESGPSQKQEDPAPTQSQVPRADPKPGPASDIARDVSQHAGNPASKASTHSMKKGVLTNTGNARRRGARRREW